MDTIGLIGKIAKAALDVGGKLSADRTNKDQNYDYLSADKILSICGQALFSQGVVVVPTIEQQATVLFEYTDAYGKAKKRYDSTINFQFLISDGITELRQSWYGMGSDYAVPDKALYKGITSGHKYFLMKLLCIGAGNEDGEHESEDDSKDRKPAAQKPAQAPAQKQGGNGHTPEAMKPWTSTLVSLELAKSTTTSPDKEGHVTPYWDMPSDKLSARYNTMVEYLKEHPELPAEKQADYQLKIDVAKAIMDYRQ